MKNFRSLYKARVFTFEDVMRELGLSRAGTSSALSRWQTQRLVESVRRNLYVAINPVSDTPIADKYEIASHISSSSYVGWHTALEFHGVAHQPFYNAFVGSESRFPPFQFKEINFEYCASPIEPTAKNGIIRPIGNPYVKVSDLERTVIDCCSRIERAGGAEELLHCMESVILLDEAKLSHYLTLYDNAKLYQKVGFILEQSQQFHQVSNEFIEMCRCKGAVHTQRLTSTGDSDTYVHPWKLYVPKHCLNIHPQEFNELI